MAFLRFNFHGQQEIQRNQQTFREFINSKLAEFIKANEKGSALQLDITRARRKCAEDFSLNFVNNYQNSDFQLLKITSEMVINNLTFVTDKFDHFKSVRKMLRAVLMEYLGIQVGWSADKSVKVATENKLIEMKVKALNPRTAMFIDLQTNLGPAQEKVAPRLKARL